MTVDERQEIAQIVTDTVKSLVPIVPKASKAVPTNDNITEVDKDPSISAAHEAEAELVKQLVNPKYMIVRGKKTTQLVNQTQQSLDSVRSYLNDRNQFGAIKTIR